MALLEVTGLRVRYGKIEAVKGIDLTVDEGQIVALIGANGAGKTTTLRTISGLLRPAEGTVVYEGTKVHTLPAHEIVALGLAHCPEGRHVFPQLTIEENLRLGAFLRRDREVDADIEALYARFPVLGERRARPAGNLSGGEQQMLAIGRATMSRPKMLLLDEPSMGLSPLMARTIMGTVAELRDQGTTILLVEQNASAALTLADRAYVLETGHVALSGTGRELLDDESVRRIYLGEH